jgi:hypothetical protein
MPVLSYSLIVSLAQATFEPSRPPMGAIIPMAAPAVRHGLVKKQEKKARRAAKLQERASVLGVNNGAGQGLPHKPASTPFERHSCRQKHEAKQKTPARRLKEDVTVSGAVKDLLKAIREGVGIIARVPKDEWGRMHAYGVTGDGEEIPSFEKTSRMFKRLTPKETRALLVITRKYRAAAKRLTASVAAAWSLWEATLSEYKRIELTGSAMKVGGHL